MKKETMDEKLKMRFDMVPVKKINPAKYNPRKELQPGDPEYEAIKQSIVTHGLADPLIWNEHNGVLIGGHQRLRILINEFHVKAVPCSIRNIKSMKEEMSLNSALNKNQGEWDFEKLKLVLANYADDDINSPLRAAMGFPALEFTGILNWVPQITNAEGLQSTPGDRLGVYEAGAIKQIVLYFDGAAYAGIVQRLEAVREKEGIDDNTTAFMRLLENYENNHSGKSGNGKKKAGRNRK
jgi:hypothetical protein